jgi:hypothetical protein
MTFCGTKIKYFFLDKALTHFLKYHHTQHSHWLGSTKGLTLARARKAGAHDWERLSIAVCNAV